MRRRRHHRRLSRPEPGRTRRSGARAAGQPTSVMRQREHKASWVANEHQPRPDPAGICGIPRGLTATVLGAVIAVRTPADITQAMADTLDKRATYVRMLAARIARWFQDAADGVRGGRPKLSDDAMSEASNTLTK